jgi:glycosyltransferase involved in cell wall biosynthesis
VVEALARNQVRAGHAVTVLTTDQGVRKGEHVADLCDGVNVQRLRTLGPDRLAYTPGFAAAARACVRASDVVHIHSIFTYPVHAALRAALAGGAPVVWRPCGQLHRYSLGRSAWRKRLYLALCGRAVRRACTAWHYTSDNESAESWPWDSSPRFVLPNAIDPDQYAVDRQLARLAVKRAWPQLGHSPYVLFLGRLHPKKRLDLLLEAFLAVAPAEFKLLVAGPDECGLWGSLAARFLRDPSAAGRVMRAGTVRGQDKVNLLAGADLFVLPSEHENFGVAALEALAAGTAVLLSPHVDLAGAVRSAGLGYTAPIRVEAWREELRRVLGDRQGLQRNADRSRRWVREHYAWEHVAAELTRRYQWVMAGCPAEEGTALTAPVGGKD